MPRYCKDRPVSFQIRSDPADARRQILAAMPWLDDSQRDVLHLVYWDGLDFSAVATHLAMTIDRARELHAAALKICRYAINSLTLDERMGRSGGGRGLSRADQRANR
jgi:DNA-directed RNA polymerase specialized sigma24 family protein